MPQVQQIETKESDGKTFTLHQLTNDSGASVSVCNWGLSIQSIQVADRSGKLGEVVIGFDDLSAYQYNPIFLGSMVGRYANRIANATFSIDGQEYILPANNGPNNLHGGPRGLAHRPWEVQKTGSDENLAFLSAAIASPDGFNGFPGTMALGATVIWTNKNELIIQFQAVTDAPTVVNLTNHSYFNLAGGGNVLDHELQLFADSYTPVDEHQIPTGMIQAVAETPFDFRRPKKINQEIALVGGYDHNFIINGTQGKLRPVAKMYEPLSGRTLSCFSTQPGVQLFTANFEEGTVFGRAGEPLPSHFGVCLETQHFPDSPNQAEFPSTLLRPGESYSEKLVYAFGVRE